MKERVFTFIAKILYLLPAAVYCGLLSYVGLGIGFDGFSILTLIYAALLIAAAILLWKNHWWGCAPGMAVGGIIIYLFETSHDFHHINETQIGIWVIVWFAVMGLICLKKK